MAPTRVKAHRIGALLFCPACGTLLDLPKDEQDEIPCGQCGRLEPASCELLVRNTRLDGACVASVDRAIRRERAVIGED